MVNGDDYDVFLVYCFGFLVFAACAKAAACWTALFSWIQIGANEMAMVMMMVMVMIMMVVMVIQIQKKCWQWNLKRQQRMSEGDKFTALPNIAKHRDDDDDNVHSLHVEIMIVGILNPSQNYIPRCNNRWLWSIVVVMEFF